MQTKPGILITEIIKDEDVKEQNLIKLSKNATGGQKSGIARIINGKKLKTRRDLGCVTSNRLIFMRSGDH